ncbi:MAG: phosphomannomutase/phosphoglucomutase [Planctomycetota bacterium]
MLGKVFKAYDVRATYPKPLNEKIAWQIGFATAQYLLGEASDAGYDDPMMRHLVVGRDMRASSPALAENLRQGMRDFGAHVIDLGRVDTSMVYFAIHLLGCAGGVMTTASHNPANYNGFKISRRGGRPVGSGSGLEEIRRLAALVDRAKQQSAGGREESRNLWASYRDHLLRFMSPSLLEGTRDLKVVVDASNGMAGTMVPELFTSVKGIQLSRLNFDNESGEFAHEPNPLVEANLAQVREAVVKRKAAIGFCFDGDADRCMVVDERGEPVGCDLILAWLVSRFLERSPGAAVVYDLRSSRVVRESIEESGGRPVEERVGHVFMKARMAAEQAVVGGELSGHFYFRDTFNADNGARMFVEVVSALAESRKPLSKLIAPFRRYAHSGEINFQNEDPAAALAALRKAFPKAKLAELDGLSLDAGDWWCNVRTSNTEPLLRLNLEAKDRKTLDAQFERLAPMLGERVAH